MRPSPSECLSFETADIFTRIGLPLACENIRFSSLFAAGDVSRGGTSATQQQKFNTDDANQCLHNKSGSRGSKHKFVQFCVSSGRFW